MLTDSTYERSVQNQTIKIKGKWEKDRRKRLNDAFERLNKVLPSYDPSVNIPKIDIIEQATGAIQDLSDRLKKALSSEEKENTKGDVLVKFELRLKKLLLRNEFLSNLLKDAGIKVPNGYGTVKKRLPKWSNKVSPEQAKMLQKQALEKENVNESKSPKRKKPSSRNSVKLRQKQLKVTIEKRNKRRKIIQTRNSKCVIIFSQAAPINNPFYVVPGGSGNKSDIASTTSSILKTPLVSANIHRSLFSENPTLSSLGPGTLLFANGSVVPINQFPLPPPTLIANPVSNDGNSTIIIVSKPETSQCLSNSTKFVSLDPLKVFVPKLPVFTLPQIFPNMNSSKLCSTWPRIRPKWCSTSTTQVNKVPIPALTSKYNNYVYISNTKPPIVACNKEVSKDKEIKSNVNIKSCIPVKRKSDYKISQTVKKPKTDVIGKIRENISKSDVETAVPVSLHEEAIAVTTELKNKISSTVEPQKVYSEVDTGMIDSSKEQVTEKTDVKCTTNSKTKSSDTVASKSLEAMTYTSNTNVNNTKKPLESNAQSDVSEDLQKVANKDIDSGSKQNLDLNLTHSDLSSDLFASLQVPPGCRNPGSTSPTAAFLLAFPLVSSGAKAAEVVDGENNSSSHTPNLLQIGTIEETKPAQTQAECHSESLTPSLLTMENFSFFTQKDACGSSFNSSTTVVTSIISNIFSNTTKTTPALFDDLFYNQAISSLTSYNPPTTSSKLNSAVPDLQNQNIITSELYPIVTSHIIPTASVTSIISNSKISSCKNQVIPKNDHDIAGSNPDCKKKSSDPKSFNKNSDFAFCNSLYASNTEIPSTSTFTNKGSHLVSEGISFPASIYGSATDSQYLQGVATNISLAKNKIPVPALGTKKKEPIANNFEYFVPYTESNTHSDSSRNTNTNKTFVQNKAADQKGEAVDLPGEKKSNSSLYNQSRLNTTLQRNLWDLNNSEIKSYSANNSSQNKGTMSKELFVSHLTPSRVEDSNIKPITSKVAQQSLTNQNTYNKNIFDNQNHLENIVKSNFTYPSNETCGKDVNQGVQRKIDTSLSHSKISNNCKVGSSIDPNLNILGLPAVANKVHKSPMVQNDYIESVSNHNVNRFSENNANRNYCPAEKTQDHISNSSQQSQNISNFNYYPLPLSGTITSSAKAHQESSNQKAVLSNSNQFKFPQASGSNKQKDGSINHQNFVVDNFGYTSYSSGAKKSNESNLYQNDFSNNYKNKNMNQIFGAENFNFNRYYPEKRNEQIADHKHVGFPNKTNEYSNYSNKNVSCSYAPIVSNFNPCYTNAGNYYYDYHADNNYGNSYLKDSSNHGNSSYYFDYNACSENAKQNRISSTGYSSSLDPYNRDKFASVITTKSESSNQQNKPVNWMTTPNNNVRPKHYPLPPFSKMNDNTLFNTSGHFNAVTSYTSASLPTDVKVKKNLDMNNPGIPKRQGDENQFSWSPSKVPAFLDSSHSFVSATLPTLVGDLALNTQPSDHKPNKEKITKENVRKTGTNYEVQTNHPNFLSVSQLVENKDPTPAKVTSRRNSGSRAKNSSPQKGKRPQNKEQNKEMQNYQKVDKINVKNSSDLFCDTKQQSMKNYNNKNVASSYSAEALIGHSVQSDSKRNKAVVPSFFTDNLVTYFPPIDSQLPQDSSYIQQQQNYQSTSFSHSFANSSIISNPATTYLPAPSFLNDNINHEFCPDGLNLYNSNVSSQVKDYNKESGKPNIKLDRTNSKKPKKRNTNDGILPSFDIPFLSIPNAINSPILPDDFHHTFLPPTTPYPCKNPLYPKQNTELTALLPPLPPVPGSKAVIQHPEVSPLINSVGTSLTNFNLSTIFPEINKGHSGSVYPDNKFKDQPVSQNYTASSSANFGKPTFTFSSYNNS